MSDPDQWANDEAPAWSLPAGAERPITAAALPFTVEADWAYGDRTGAGVRVCIVDSGIDPGHPQVGPVAEAVTVELPEDGDGRPEPRVVPDSEGDVSGHGTACAGIVRSLAPQVEIASARVLGADVNGLFAALEAGLAWALEQRYDVINLSLSVRSPRFALRLCELADRAAHQHSLLVCSAHNLPVESYPWRFASVLSVAAHDEPDPWLLVANPDPPVELFARGTDVPIAWPGGGSARATGNSFATPHLTGHAALVRAAHPRLTASETKAVLRRLARNVHQPPLVSAR